ncbi:aminotransferase class III-fold pyridoxal phosphate-dependent enzyme [Comamonas sp. JC664]|uniref:aminotransferase class III-fold pyridoxal phosphate-dependent enzyme n=1 Tax=Comamonas sp. JC664 TaxID=2801917 RepID=UPI0036179F38
MRAGVETIAIMEEEGLLANATKVGDYLQAALNEALAGTPGFVEVRGQGLMNGVELNKPLRRADHARRARKPACCSA